MGKKEDREIVRKSLVILVIDLALEKAEKLEYEKLFEVTLPQQEIPEGFHYGEILGEVETSATKTGLVFMGSERWTYRFYKRTPRS